MLDTNLIKISTDHAIQSIKNSTIVNNNLKLITDFLHPELVSKLEKFIFTVDESQWTMVTGLDLPSRRSINWVFDSVIEEIHILSENLTDQINSLFNTSDKKFLGLQIWRDTGGYVLPPHLDNPIIDISIQVYLFECEEIYGTTFQIDNKEFILPFKHNTGYSLYKKSNEDRILHWSTLKLPDEMERYSLYLIWGVDGQNSSNP